MKRDNPGGGILRLSPLSGQALLEFALTGSLALLALAFLIQLGLRMNYQQEIEQQTFRRAMQVAQSEGDEESQIILYHHFLDRQVPDPSQEFAIMPRTTAQAQAAVTWGEYLTFLADDRDSQPRIVVRLNKSKDEFRSEDLQEDESLPLVRQIQKDLQSTGTLSQTGSGGNLSATLSTETTEATTLTLNANGGATVSSSLTAGCDFSDGDFACSGE